MFKIISRNNKLILAGSLFVLVMFLVSIFFYISYRNKQDHLIDSLKRILDNNGSISYYRDGNIERPIIETFQPYDLEICNIFTRHRIKYINGIYCVGYQLLIEDIVLFGTLEYLNYFGFVDVNLSESHLKFLVEKIPHLQNLTIERSTFPNNGGKYLGKLKKIRSLWLCDLLINDDDIRGMGGLPLREIIFINVAITDTGLNNMLPLKEIENITLRELPISDDITVFFNGCPSLKRIGIHNSKRDRNTTTFELKCIFLRDMIHTSSIKEITLNYVMLDDETLSSIERFENLKYLAIRSYCITENSKPLLERLSQRMYVSVETLGKEDEPLFEYHGGEKFIDYSDPL
jgi:hypothetical protein